MATDLFLKIDSIDGESVSKGYEKWIEISSFQFGVSNATTLSGGSAAKPEFSDVTVTAQLSSATIPLVLATATGRRFKSAQLAATRLVDGQPQTYYTIKLADLLVSSAAESSGGDLPSDAYSLRYSKIEFAYARQNPDGTAAAPVTGGYDLRSGKVV